MPSGMFLKSTLGASSLSTPHGDLTLEGYCGKRQITPPDDLRPIPRQLFVDYGLDFQERQVEDVDTTTVTELRRSGHGFILNLANGREVSASSVVLATGHLDFAYIPESLRAVVEPGPDSPITHASAHVQFDRFAGKKVAVVGAGQSALESAVLLSEAGADVHLLVRETAIVWGDAPKVEQSWLRRLAKPSSPLGPGWSLFTVAHAPAMVRLLPTALRLYLVRRILGPSGAWFLHDRFLRVNSVLATSIRHVVKTGRGLQLTCSSAGGGESQLDVDHVVAATGYKVDIEKLRFLHPEVRRNLWLAAGSAAPILSHNFESSVPNLYFAGLSAAPTFGPLLRFVCGASFAARRITAGIVSVSDRS
jgi:cation diffusion facilitator CzcD-associated flavoprotein CzcO